MLCGTPVAIFSNIGVSKRTRLPGANEIAKSTFGGPASKVKPGFLTFRLNAVDGRNRDIRVTATTTNKYDRCAAAEVGKQRSSARCAKFGNRSPVGRQQQMVRPQGGRWVVSTKDNAVYVERLSESDERVLEDSLTAEEARELAGLLTKYADKLDESADSGKTEESDDSEESGKSEDSDEAGKSEDSDKSDGSDDSDESKDSDKEDSDKSEKSSD
jgi:hypothetical protein